MTHEEFVTWKNSELTQERFKEIEAIVEIYKEEWVNYTVTEKEDAYNRGIVKGLRMSMEEADD